MSTINLGEHQGDGIRYSMHLSAPAGGAAQMLRDPAGNWVGYADYAALQAENERMRKELEALDGDIVAFDEYCEELVHNERLRQAGDALLECHKIRDDLAYSIQEQSPDVAKAMLEWLAAKETRP